LLQRTVITVLLSFLLNQFFLTLCIQQDFSIQACKWTLDWTIYPTKLHLGTTGYVIVWVRNIGDFELYIYKIWLQWDWNGNFSHSKDTNVYLSIGEKKYVGRIYFSVPEDITPGYHAYRLGISVKYKSKQSWIDIGRVWNDWETIEILEKPSISLEIYTFLRLLFDISMLICLLGLAYLSFKTRQKIKEKFNEDSLVMI